MNSADRFRVGVIVVAVLMLAYTFAALFSETFSTNKVALPTDLSKAVVQPIGPMARGAAAIAPFRADLEGTYASAVAIAALRPDKEKLSAAGREKNDQAQRALTRVLRAAPFNSELWLLLALLQSQRRSGDPQANEALKMSYFTAPNEAQLMPLRISTATLSDALSDPDLKELARGDVRLMLRQSDLRTALVSAYQAGSNVGKMFLEDAVQSIEPQFVAALRKPG